MISEDFYAEKTFDMEEPPQLHSTKCAHKGVLCPVGHLWGV